MPSEAAGHAARSRPVRPPAISNAAAILTPHTAGQAATAQQQPPPVQRPAQPAVAHEQQPQQPQPQALTRKQRASDKLRALRLQEGLLWRAYQRLTAESLAAAAAKLPAPSDKLPAIMVRKTIALAETVAAQRASLLESGTVDVELAPPGHPLRKLVDARYQPTKRHFKHLLTWLMHFAVPHGVDSCSALACLRYYGLCLACVRTPALSTTLRPGDQLTTADLDCRFILFRCPNTSWQLFAATDLSLARLLTGPQPPPPAALLTLAAAATATAPPSAELAWLSLPAAAQNAPQQQVVAASATARSTRRAAAAAAGSRGARVAASRSAAAEAASRSAAAEATASRSAAVTAASRSAAAGAAASRSAAGAAASRSAAAEAAASRSAAGTAASRSAAAGTAASRSAAAGAAAGTPPEASVEPATAPVAKERPPGSHDAYSDLVRPFFLAWQQLKKEEGVKVEEKDVLTRNELPYGAWGVLKFQGLV